MSRELRYIDHGPFGAFVVENPDETTQISFCSDSSERSKRVARKEASDAMQSYCRRGLSAAGMSNRKFSRRLFNATSMVMARMTQIAVNATG